MCPTNIKAAEQHLAKVFCDDYDFTIIAKAQAVI